MERWRGRVALVTGASVGIGAAVAERLVREGLVVLGVARRADKIRELASTLKDAEGKLHAFEADVTDEQKLLDAFQWAKDNLGGVDVLVNNAGIFIESNLSDGNTEEWRRILDVNVLALTVASRELLKSLKERGRDDGHIFHINSVSGHFPIFLPGGGMYSASKFAVTTLTEALRQELKERKSKVKVTSISPGLVKTEIISRGNTRSFQEEYVWQNHPYLEPSDIADALQYALATPPKVQIQELIIRPLGEI